ncbi:MAG: sulfatase-like hydrolase/transferase [Paenibacillaceae bacterium]|nr:sulfatase-like hydrolase/transferase [Paenibacillaceae bacterium]
MATNTVLFMSDQHNPVYSSVYGHPFVQTPHMEAMAARGTLYRRAYCPSPLCMPSRSAFMAGKRVHELQAYSNCTIGVPQQADTYGRRLAEQGVFTVYIGKTDVFAAGDRLGFSRLLEPKDRRSPGDVHIGRRPIAVRPGAEKRANAYGVKESAFDDDLAKVDLALRWLHDEAPCLERPWVLVVNVINPHPPQWNTDDYWRLYPEADLPAHGVDRESARHPHAADLRAHFGTDAVTEEQARGLRRGYFGNVSFVDRQLGRLIDALDRTGLAATTNLLYVSDHGEMLGKFGLWGKCSLYEDSVRIPCLAMGPDYRAAAVVETAVDLFDVQASLFRSAGAVRPPDWAGQPLQDVPDDDPERIVFAEYHGHGTRSGAYMIRCRDWKLVYHMDAPHQLFHLAEDLDELRNVIADYPEMAQRLEAELRRICSPERENENAFRFQQRQLALLADGDANLGDEAGGTKGG